MGVSYAYLFKRVCLLVPPEARGCGFSPWHRKEVEALFASDAGLVLKGYVLYGVQTLGS